MPILVVVTFGGLSFFLACLTPLPVLLLLIRSSAMPCVGHTSERTYGCPSLTCVSPPPAHAPYQQPGASPEHTIGWSNNQLAPRRCTLAEKSE